MKSLTLIAVLALASINSFAAMGNDGPSGAPMRPEHPEVIAVQYIACGFCRNGDVRTVQVFDNGVVEKSTSGRGVPKETVKIATLEKEVVANLQAQIERLQNQELVDQQQGQPECMDAPTTTSLVKKANGEELKIAQNYGCHEHLLPGREGQAIRKLLDAMMSLSN